jgi:hypothetical protein
MSIKKPTVLKELVIFATKDEQMKPRGDFDRETIWVSLDDIAQIFGRNKSVISRHLRNIFNVGELDKSSVIAKNATTAGDSKTYQVEYHNLDVIISVGYRVNSIVATKFRQWATKTLREHITKGFTINPKQIKQNHEAFLVSIEKVKMVYHHSLV